MNRVLITGKNSYVGINVKRYLEEYSNGEKYQVDLISVRENWEECDFSKYDVVLHLAAIVHKNSVNIRYEEKKEYYNVNRDLAVKVAKKAKKANVKQFIFMSTMSVYGNTERVSKDTLPSPEKNNYYGKSKLQGEEKIIKLEDENFKVAVLRPPMIYGRNCKGNYAKLAKLAHFVPVFPKVKNVKSMIYIDNLSEFIRLVIENKESGIFLPQNERVISTYELIQMIGKEEGRKIYALNILNPLVGLGKILPGKMGNMCRKAFGNNFYDMKASKYKCNYIIKDFEQSVTLSMARED
jgi:UDP-glucose 4-epimerase